MNKTIARSANYTLARGGTPRGFILRVTKWGGCERFTLLFEDGQIRNCRDALAARTREPAAFEWTEKALRQFHATNPAEGYPDVKYA